MLVDKQGAYAHDVLSVCMGPTMYACLPWKGCVDAQVPVDTEEGLDTPLLVPLRRFIEPLRNSRKHLAHDLLDPPAAEASENISSNSFQGAHLILMMIGASTNSLTLARLSLCHAVRSAC